MIPIEFLPAEIELLQGLVADYLTYCDGEGDDAPALKPIQDLLHKLERYEKHQKEGN